MQPSTIIGQAAQAMNSGQAPLNQVSNTAPTFKPGIQTPPAAPMPEKSPMTAIPKTALEKAFERRKIQYPTQIGQQRPMVTLPEDLKDSDPNQSGTQVPLTEAERIIKVLEKRLDRHNKTEDAMVNHMFPKVGPESKSALENMANTLDSGNQISIEDMGVLDQHAKDQLRIPKKVMSKMTPSQKLAEILGAIQAQ